VRVGVDQRSATARNGKPPLKSGIYALCEVESEAYGGTGANDEHWADGEGREPGWPTVKIRYLQTYADKPLTIDMLRDARPSASKLLLNGFQAASFRIPADDFRAVMELLGEDLDDLPSPPPNFDTTSAALAAMEKKYRHASPEVKERISKYIERGSIGGLVKKQTGFKCQVCDALGRDPLGFKKKSGEHYVEAHHVKAVSGKEVGSLGASNVMTVCANHHRQLHYGGINVVIGEESFEFVIETKPVKIPRLKFALEGDGAAAG